VYIYRARKRDWMPVEFEVTRQTKASLSKAMDFYMHPENLPKIHPDYVKEVKIVSTDGDTIMLEQQMDVMGMKIRAVNKMVRKSEQHEFETDTVEGDGKGSKITIALKEIPSGTEIRYFVEMETGSFPIGFLGTGSIIRRPYVFFDRVSQFFGKVADEDKKVLDEL
jgi:hypothetical protein